MNDGELMRLLMRTSMLVRRSHHGESGGPAGTPGRCPHGHHGPGPHGRGHHGAGRHGQGRVLAALFLEEGQSQKKLASALGIRPQSLSEILLKLEDEDMIERRKSQEDGRVVNVYLTHKGREGARRAAEARRKNAEDTLSVLDEEEKKQLGAILSKLAASLEEE